MSDDSLLPSRLASLFRSIPLTSLVQLERPLVTIPMSSSIAAATDTILSERIFGAPVDNTAKSARDNSAVGTSIVGMLDVVHIAKFAVQQLVPGSSRENEASGIHPAFTECSVAEIYSREEFVPLDENASFLDLLLLMGTKGLRRVPIIRGNEVVNLITLSTVARELLRLAPLDGNEALQVAINSSIESLGLAQRSQVVSVDIDTPLQDAFRLMASTGVSAVAVTGTDGSMLGNVSARDVAQLIQQPPFWASGKSATVRQYLQGRAIDNPVEVPVTCTEKSSLKLVLMRLVATKLHRVYVVDGMTRAPSRVLSLSDVVGALATQVPPPPATL